jgi:tRNA modification GTPase
MLYTDDTIAAQATAPGAAGVAVVRVSGTGVRALIEDFFDAAWSPIKNPRRLIYGRIIDPKSGAVIDHALAVFMPGPYSFTGEDTLEFQTHGSQLLIKQLLSALYQYGVRAAEPGEFTKRAFLNGKMDLTQAEALADLISAGSMRALKIAEDQLNGKLGTLIAQMGEDLRDITAEIEAGIDFPEEDIEPEQLHAIKSKLQHASLKFSELVDSFEYGHIVRDGYRVLLCGRPNAGKSSLLNALLNKPRAIVSEISGTTRDLIEESAEFEGYRFVFCDSAGLRESSDPVEKIGIELALDRTNWADLALLVVDINESPEEIKQTINLLSERCKKIWIVVNKIDTQSANFGASFCDDKRCQQTIYLSALSGEGIQGLISALIDEVSSQLSVNESSQVITSERQKNCLIRACDALSQTLIAIDQKLPSELIASDLRTALSNLDEMIGKTHPEDILGRIFSKFCIGK